MKNIVLAFAFLISTNVFAAESFCAEGDRNCTVIVPGGAGANAVGVEGCPECSAFLKDSILLSETRTLPSASGGAATTGGASNNKAPVKQ